MINFTFTENIEKFDIQPAYTQNSMATILTRQEYCGDVVNFKTNKHYRNRGRLLSYSSYMPLFVSVAVLTLTIF